jgi:hypothetical protein
MTVQKTEPFYGGPRKSALYVAIYDLQGGPFPERAATAVEIALEDIARQYDGLAITVVKE